MARVNVLVITGYSTNCEQESAYAVWQAGTDEAQIVYSLDIATVRIRIEDSKHHILPGGFLNNSDLLLGICNSFQLLIKLGFLTTSYSKYFVKEVSLSNNYSARFKDRWAWLKANSASPCMFTKDLDRLYLSVRHGEGNIILNSQEILDDIVKNQLVALQYCRPEAFPPPTNNLGWLSGEQALLEDGVRFLRAQ